MTLPKWFDKNRESVNRRSQEQERKRAKEIGGHVQAGSGSSWRAPQDVVGKEHLEQLKFTDRKSITIHAEDWIQLRADASRSGREPRYILEFKQEGIRLIVTEA